jgi:cytochrome c biogenesis protein CcdA
MIALVALVVSVGLADSLNPTTIGPALYLATTKRAARSLSAFTLGVFGTYLVGGLVLTLGPGQLLLSALPTPSRHVKHLVEIVLGVAALVLALALWLRREHLARGLEKAQQRPLRGRSSFGLGAGITAFELPTALPYFAVIAAIIDADRGVAVSVALIVLFNVAFVAPLLAILVARVVLGERAERWFARVRPSVMRWAPQLVPALILVVAISLFAVGGIGLAADT